MTEQAETFTFTDTVPEKGNPVGEDILVCQECGTPLEYSGKGRKPKYCDEHKKNKTTRTSTGRRSNSAVIERAISELSTVYGMAGQGLKFVHPIAGETVFQRRNDLAESYRMLLETNSRFRKLFLEVEGKAAWLPILAVHAEMIGSIMVMSKVQKEQDQNDTDESQPQFNSDIFNAAV